MKKLYILFAFLFSASFANATIHGVQVQASSFSPSTVNAVCGDTIVWVWAGSGSHTTTSTTIPGCATAWDQPIGPTSFTFAITVPCTGTYNYVCTPHGFTGVINVSGSCPSGVNDINTNYLSVAYPNPSTSNVTIEFPAADMITLYNTLGEKVKTIVIPSGQTKAELSIADVRQGIYFYSIIKEGTVIETRKITKR